MKKLLKKSTTAPTEIHTSDENKKSDKIKCEFTFIDIVDILQQLEELKNYNIAIKVDDGRLLLAVGDVVYEISEKRSQRYPARSLRKLEN